MCIDISNQEKCVVCGACIDVCPVEAIQPVFVGCNLVKVIDNEACICCGACEEECREDAIKITSAK